MCNDGAEVQNTSAPMDAAQRGAAQLSSICAARALLKRRNSRARRATPSTSPRSSLKTKTLVSRRPTLATRHLSPGKPWSAQRRLCHTSERTDGLPQVTPTWTRLLPHVSPVSHSFRDYIFLFLFPLTLLSQCSCCLSGDS